jgi:carbonic anhydrase
MSTGWPSRTRAESVAEDVRRIRPHPLVPRDIPIYGHGCDVMSGRLMPEATRTGKAA